MTTIEFISRSNKRAGPGRREYLRKRKVSYKAGVSIVEIDLLRGGRPVTLASPDLLTPQLRTPYHACAMRALRPQWLEYYPMPLRSPLPVMLIPPRETDADVKLGVQSLVDEAFRRGRYDDIDYTVLLDPPLSADDATWVTQIVGP